MEVAESDRWKMRNELTILIAEDDPGHFVLAKRHFEQMGVRNRILRFNNGRDLLDYTDYYRL